jgi:hypothetical protein
MSDPSAVKVPGFSPKVLIANTFVQNGLDAAQQPAPMDMFKSFRDTGVAIIGEVASRCKGATKFAPIIGRGYNAFNIYEAKQEKNAELKRAKDTGTLPDQKKLNDCGKKMFSNAMDMVSPGPIPVGTIVFTTVEFATVVIKNPPSFKPPSPEAMEFFRNYGGN